MMREPESLVEINLHNLEEAIQDQPVLSYRYGLLLADARNKLAEAKALVDLTYAKLALDVRNNPHIYKLTKVTDDSVESAINNDSRLQKAVEERNDAEYEVNQYFAIVQALNHRMSCIEAAVKGHGFVWFSDPDTRTVKNGVRSTVDRE